MVHDGVPYVCPRDVVSPQSNWELITVLYNGGDEGWSVAEGKWREDGEENWKSVVAIRWNRSHTGSHKGHPLSRGYPVWFIVPDELEKVVRREAKKLKVAKPGLKT